jgi:hypothetical protein
VVRESFSKDVTQKYNLNNRKEPTLKRKIKRMSISKKGCKGPMQECVGCTGESKRRHEHLEHCGQGEEIRLEKWASS